MGGGGDSLVNIFGGLIDRVPTPHMGVLSMLFIKNINTRHQVKAVLLCMHISDPKPKNPLRIFCIGILNNMLISQFICTWTFKMCNCHPFNRPIFGDDVTLGEVVYKNVFVRQSKI